MAREQLLMTEKFDDRKIEERLADRWRSLSVNPAD
jgi:hypothetical protein